MSSRSCSGCGKPGTRVDFCPVCSPDSPRTYDARSLQRKTMAVQEAPKPAVKHRRAMRPGPLPGAPIPPTGRWALYFVPYGSEQPRLLDRVTTFEDGRKLADAHNKLDWQEHDLLGADKMMAMGRHGAFVLEPESR